MNKFSTFIFTYRKFIIISWIITILLFSYFAFKLPSVLSGNGFIYDGEYIKTEEILEKEFGHSPSTILLIFERKKNVDDTSWKSYIENSIDNLYEVEDLVEVISPFDRKGMMKETIAYGVLSFDKPSDKMGDTVSNIREKLKNENGMNVNITGEPVIVKDLNEASQKDLAKAEMIGLPIALLVLLLSFGSLVAASIPLLIGVVSIIITMGIVYFFHYSFDLSIFILNIVPMIGLALSIDFALLFINRFKEEIKEKSTQDAIMTTIATAGRSVVFSGLCVFIGLLGLMFIQIDIFQNVAIGGMTVVLVSAFCAVTFLPAILSVLGHNINKVTILKEKGNEHGIWSGFAKFVMKRPVIMLIVALTILITGLIPVKDMNLVIPGTDSLPTSYESRVAFERFQDEFVDPEKEDENKVMLVLETNGDVINEENLTLLKTTIDTINKDSLVATIDSPFSLTGITDPAMFYQLVSTNPSPEIAPVLQYYINENKMLTEVYLNKDIKRHEAQDWVREWSEKELEVEANFGGFAKFEQELFDEIFKKAPYGLALVLLSTFFILMIAFRSLLIPLKAIIMNMLSLSATFGIIVWIFQEGHFGLEPVAIALVLPVFVFSLVFGLSMDYEVFLISRIHEEYMVTRDNNAATLHGLISTSKIITSAAAIMIVITGAFAFTGVMPVKQMGVGIALAIFIDATIVRMVLVPSLMKLLGDWNWWFFGQNKVSKNHE
ncbi:MMPL family transporter [Bacillus suaedaesalsae]|uniref:MMPL family transporter n=1 Tax=Bacillus suaedaesalsae TaxID=2810349 RepID=A0ABS2DEX6_9BACI|nr:MMPL family transporter [Bacillus suaedaesalsae]MBM6617007.1 MMPL family transporter [Bacillus suaedaesalsae]